MGMQIFGAYGYFEWNFRCSAITAIHAARPMPPGRHNAAQSDRPFDGSQGSVTPRSATEILHSETDAL